MNLEKKILTLEKQVAILLELSKTKDDLLRESWSRIEELEKENKELRFIIEGPGSKKVKKNSRNSNLPPSSDIGQPNRNKSLRKKSNKKRGGQQGHEGFYLKMRDNVDQEISLKLDNCPDCGECIKDFKKIVVRQELFIPPIKVQCREYQQYDCQCTHCNKTYRKPFPDYIKAPIQYGKDIVALNAYISSYQFIPYQRSQGMLKDLFGLEICQATLKNQLVSFDKSAEDSYEIIRSFIETSEVVGSDETSAKVNGDLNWIWTFQTPKATYLCCDERRNFEVIPKHFPNQFPETIYVSDRYKAHLKVEAKEHQICWAHLLRTCNYLIEAEESKWAKEVKQLFYQAKKLKKRYQELKPTSKSYQQIQNSLNKLLIRKIDKNKKETKTLQKSLLKYKDFLFTFLRYKAVPSDNNGSERAIRNVKVKLKISGQFIKTQHVYCRIRSIIDTCIKNGQSVMDNLASMAAGKGLLFDLT